MAKQMKNRATTRSRCLAISKTRQHNGLINDADNPQCVNGSEVKEKKKKEKEKKEKKEGRNAL